jgi:hypothetical protein
MVIKTISRENENRNNARVWTSGEQLMEYIYDQRPEKRTFFEILDSDVQPYFDIDVSLPYQQGIDYNSLMLDMCDIVDAACQVHLTHIQ